MRALTEIAQMPVVQRLGWVLVHSFWQIAILGLLLVLVRSVMRRASSQSRYVAACVGLVLSAAIPLLTYVMQSGGPQTTPPVAIATPAPGTVQQPGARRENQDEMAAFSSTTGRSVMVGAPPLRERLFVLCRNGSTKIGRVAPWLVTGWMLGITILSLSLMAGWFQVQAMKRRRIIEVSAEWQQRFAGVARKIGVSRPVRLVQSRLAEVPMVIGWLRPVILLPVSVLSGLSSEQLEAVLAHELAHIRRHDYLVNLLQSAIETALFYHPVVWWIGRRIREERENACDDLAVEACGDRIIYARALTQLETMRGVPEALAPAASGGSLLLRVRRLAGRGANREPLSSWWAAGFVVAFLALAVVAGIVAPVRAGDKAPQARIIQGMVVSPAGGAVPEARVTLVVRSFVGGKEPASMETKTDQTGRFRFEAPESAKNTATFMCVEAPGFALTAQDVDTAVDRPMRIALEEPVIVEVKTVNEAGEPLPGIFVQPDFLLAPPFGYHPFPKPMAERLTQATDAAGQARFPDMPRFPQLRVKIADSRYAHATNQEQTNRVIINGTTGFTLRLLPASAIRGRVRIGATGEPVPNVPLGSERGRGGIDRRDRHDGRRGPLPDRPTAPGCRECHTRPRRPPGAIVDGGREGKGAIGGGGAGRGCGLRHGSRCADQGASDRRGQW